MNSMSSMNPTNKDLKCWYDSANRLYFGNKLPKDLKVKFGKLRSRVMGSTYMVKNRGKLSAQSLYIADDLKKRPALVVLTLLHEMVHVEHPSWNHGWPFNKRMKKLANDGAFNGLW